MRDTKKKGKKVPLKDPLRGSPTRMITYFTNRYRGFTLLELIMVVVIIAFLAAISFGQIQTILQQGELTKEREWVKTVVTAIESYHADIGVYPNNVSELTGAVPPYLSNEFAAKCGRNEVIGGYQFINMCIFNNINSHYMIQYIQWDLNGPVMLAQYYERLYKIPFNTGVCGVMPPGTKYFYEQFHGKVTMSSCGYTG